MAIFGHLSDDIFQIFAGSNRHLYARVIRDIYQEFFAGTIFTSPFRPDVTHFLTVVVRNNADLWADEETLRDLPPPPGRRGRKRIRRSVHGSGQSNDEIVKRAHHIYARLIETGWIEEEEWGFRTQVEMPPAAMALADQLSQIEQGLSQLFAGVVAEIRTSLNAIEKGDEQSLLALPKAAETSTSFVRRLRGIKSQLRYVRKALMESDNLDERLRYFFDEFVDQIVITDFSSLLTTDHPYNHRHDINSAIESIRDNDSRRHQIAEKYVEASIGKNVEDALGEVDSHLNQIESTMASIDEFIGQLMRFRSRLEEKLRNTVKYMDRADDRYCDDVVELVRRIDSIEQRSKALGRTPDMAPGGLLPSPRHWAAGLNAEPRSARPEIKPRTIKKKKPDPVMAVYKRLARDFANLFQPRSDADVRRFLEKWVAPSGTEARDIAPRDLDEFLLFDDIRRRRMRSKSLLDGQFTIEPAEGVHDSEWVTCPNFKIRRHDEIPGKDANNAGLH